MNSNWDIAKRLIEAGADVNEWDIFGQAPLHVAIGNMNSRGNGNPLDMDTPNKATGREIVQMLVDRGANPNQQIVLPGRRRAASAAARVAARRRSWWPAAAATSRS